MGVLVEGGGRLLEGGVYWVFYGITLPFGMLQLHFLAVWGLEHHLLGFPSAAGVGSVVEVHTAHGQGS